MNYAQVDELKFRMILNDSLKMTANICLFG